MQRLVVASEIQQKTCWVIQCTIKNANLNADFRWICLLLVIDLMDDRYKAFVWRDAFFEAPLIDGFSVSGWYVAMFFVSDTGIKRSSVKKVKAVISS